ncbi:MAG: D-alanyl-D-alanine carboxypeptidase/D-alanyl-D-alanine endopeptidase, partial [Dehalococcoidia bacterium]
MNPLSETKQTPNRRRLLRATAGGALAVAAAGAIVPTRTVRAQNPLPASVQTIMGAPRYAIARWFLYVADRATGEALYSLNGNDLALPASTTKLWTTAAALDAYGPDFRFETPVYRRGSVDAQGDLQGDLILVASGDLTMGGRDTADGHIAFAPLDHAEANALPGATLTPQDPLAGLDDLARQVAAGIRRVRGNVLIDARLFDQTEKDDYILTPIMINDNLVDITVTPGGVGGAATIEWRPQTAAYRVQSTVRTIAAGQPSEVTVRSPQPGLFLVEGEIAADGGSLLRTGQIEDPQAAARTMLIEALGRQGVTVDTTATGPNPIADLPPSGSYADADRVALHTSLPFSENIKLINKVSMNVQADTLIMLLAVKNGERTFDEGMTRLVPFIQKAGINPDTMSLSDGRGNEYTDLFSPRTVTELLRYMTTRPDFPAYFDSMPIFGVDGTETTVVPPTSPVAGKAQAKSGTTVAGDLMNQRLMLMTRGNAGYLTSKSGRELVFGLYVMYVPMMRVDDVFDILKNLGSIVEVIYENT